MFRTSTMALFAALATAAPDDCSDSWLGFNLGGQSPKDAFDSLDDDASGRLSGSEFRNAFGDFGATDGVNRNHPAEFLCTGTFDLNDDGEIDWYEWNLAANPSVEYRCAHAIFTPANGSEVYGWAQIFEPTNGAYAGYAQVTASIRNFPEDDGKVRPGGSNTGKHGFHIHKFDDLGNNCGNTSRHYNPGEDDVNKPAIWFLGELDNADLVVLPDDNDASQSSNRADYFAWDELVTLDGEYSVLDRSFVVHDNNCADPSCASLTKTRIACGAIREGCYPGGF